MRGILINSNDRTVSEVEYDGNWRSIGPTIGCELFTVVSGLPEGDDLYVDDEGLLRANEKTTFFRLPWYPAPLAGSGLVLGFDPETGDTVAARGSVEEYRSRVSFMSSQAVWLWNELHGTADFNPVRIGANPNERGDS